MISKRALEFNNPYFLEPLVIILPQRSRNESSMINQTTQMLSMEYMAITLVEQDSPSSVVLLIPGSVSMQKSVVETTMARMDRKEMIFARVELVGFSKSVQIFILVVLKMYCIDVLK